MFLPQGFPESRRVNSSFNALWLERQVMWQTRKDCQASSYMVLAWRSHIREHRINNRKHKWARRHTCYQMGNWLLSPSHSFVKLRQREIRVSWERTGNNGMQWHNIRCFGRWFRNQSQVKHLYTCNRILEQGKDIRHTIFRSIYHHYYMLSAADGCVIDSRKGVGHVCYFLWI